MYDIVKNYKDGRVHILLYTPDVEELPVELFEIYSTAEYTGLDGITTNYILVKDSDSEELMFVVKEEEISDGNGGDLADNISYRNSNYPSWTNVKKALDGIMAKIDYIKPEITSFTSTAQAIYEVGQKVSNIVFNWSINKNVTSQSLTDCSLADANIRTVTYTKEVSSNKTFTLTVGDGQNTASKSVSISFRNKIYYGSAVIPNSFNSAFILGLSNNQLVTGKNGNYTINVANNEYGFLSYPSSFGNISSVYIGGFETEVENCGTISFTNASGGTTNYNIYRTKQNSLGTIKMEVK